MEAEALSSIFLIFTSLDKSGISFCQSTAGVCLCVRVGEWGVSAGRVIILGPSMPRTLSFCPVAGYTNVTGYYSFLLS